MVLLRWLSSWFLISKRNIQVHQKDTVALAIHSSCLKALNDGRCLRLNQDLSREFKVKLPPMHINLTSCGCFQWKPRILVAMILCTLKVPLVTVAINCAFVLFAYSDAFHSRQNLSLRVSSLLGRRSKGYGKWIWARRARNPLSLPSLANASHAGYRVNFFCVKWVYDELASVRTVSVWTWNDYGRKEYQQSNNNTRIWLG